MTKIKRLIRDIIIGMILNNIKESKPGKAVLDKLRQNKSLVGRIGVAIFSIFAAVKYYAPEYVLFLDDNVEVIGIILSWLALELGLEKDKQEQLKQIAEKQFDPSKPINVNLGDFVVQIPAPEEFGIKKQVSSDIDEQ